MTIGEVARLTGVTIRTLRHYDRIGLLTPSEVTGAGYRLYDDASLRRLHMILLFRELEVPLEEIRRILDDPGFDPSAALRLQERQLLMRRGHIDRLLRLIRTLQQKGMTHMDFSAFDRHQQEDWAAQARAAWGETPAYREYEQRESTRQPGDSARAGRELMGMLGEFKPQPPGIARRPRCAGLRRPPAAVHHRSLLHLHCARSPGAGGQLRNARLPTKHRRIRRRGNGGLPRAGHPHLLRRRKMSACQQAAIAL